MKWRDVIDHEFGLGERDAGDLVAHVVVMQVFDNDHVAARVGVETRKVAVGFRRIELGGDLVKEQHFSLVHSCVVANGPIFREPVRELNHHGGGCIAHFCIRDVAPNHLTDNANYVTYGLDLKRSHLVACVNDARGLKMLGKPGRRECFG